ncbi:MAG: translation initiation factor [Chitinophagaceae bacterium]|nr:MAG: translation initiation factor [Chitinophagaceae bacterium]
MVKKNQTDSRGFVYSTNPDFIFETQNDLIETVLPEQQKLKVKIETKLRAGKLVTLIEGFIGKKVDLESLGKKLKAACGTGGAIKDGTIIIQGDHRDKVVQWLLKNGFKPKRI